MKIYDTVVFHYPCQDGLASAWVVYHYHKIHNQNIELYPIQHGTPLDINKLTNKKVLFCDYSPSVEILEQLETKTTRLCILDHHISAKLALENKSYAIFDMNKSGAGLTWEYFFSEPIPDFILMIQDRDLWTWKLPKSRAFTSAFYTVCSSIEWNNFSELFKLFDKLLENENGSDFYINMGTILDKVQYNKSKYISDEHAKKINKYKEYNVCIVNCSHELASDVGNMLTSLDNVLIDFAVLWRYHHPTEEYFVSLRANNKVDVSKIAKEFGGGGHANASGFKTKINPIQLFS
jgi:oligoribonuclease NrnB/cAMP/cGMP phosphodiesterase (DHH superfamily)